MNIVKKHVKIEPLPDELLDDIEEVIIASPLWAGDLAPSIPSFVDQAELGGKSVSLITVQADPDHRSAGDVAVRMKEMLEKKNADFDKHFTFTGSSPFKGPDIESLRKQVDEIF